MVQVPSWDCIWFFDGLEVCTFVRPIRRNISFRDRLRPPDSLKAMAYRTLPAVPPGVFRAAITIQVSVRNQVDSACDDRTVM